MEVHASTDLILPVHSTQPNQKPRPDLHQPQIMANGNASQSRRDPKMLLNPKGSRSTPTKAKNEPPSPYVSSLAIQNGGEGSRTERVPVQAHAAVTGKSMNSFLEDLHGAEKRTEPPRKKIKTADGSQDESNTAQRKAAFTYRSSGIVGDYMKPNPEDEVNRIPHATVDLTNGSHFDLPT